MNFADEYSRLNDAQKEAVDQIDGPLLVVAGPGTGKTQLLSARVAKILQDTDTLPQSILCLTFTEAATQNIRDRLSSFIGKEAHDVAINTYHAFGSEIISKNPEYFSNLRLERPIDELGKRQVLAAIVDRLGFDNPLKSTQYHLGDLISTISELKRGLQTADSLRQMAKDNQAIIKQLNPKIADITKDVKTFPSSLAKAAPIFNLIETEITKLSDQNKPLSLASIASKALAEAFTLANEQNKSTPITAWKNKWLHKNSEGTFVFTDEKLSKKLLALADVLTKYNLILNENGQYDFDDMILRAIQALEKYPELRFNLQERYLYVLLDEFQDTNAAQFKLVKLLSDNEVHEGRPNIMAVGDDDQAIYAFQGAESSNMVDFANQYRDVSIVNLTDNYRSHHHILHVAHNIAGQIEDRLHKQLSGVNKTLNSVAENLPIDSKVARHEFVGKSEEYSWIATRVKKLIESGVEANGIAVLAPKHRFLEDLVPYLNEWKIPVSYEKRENILHTPIVLQLRSMIELIDALDKKDKVKADYLFPQVLSLPFFDISVEDLWKINWKFAERSNVKSWPEIALGYNDIKSHIQLFLALAGQLSTRTLESVFDVLIGSESIDISEIDSALISPLKEHYFSTAAKNTNPLLYYETLSHLSVIRSKLRDFQAGEDEQLTIDGFLCFVNLYNEADQPLMNSHPIAQAAQSVKLMTAYKTKGLEFESVFVISAQDDVWGSKARSNNNKLTIPANLKHIRHAGATEDERLRLLFVAIIRAKHNLFLTSHRATDTGTQTTRLKYLDEREENDEVISAVLPDGANKVIPTEQESIEAKQASIELGWTARHVLLSPPLKDLLISRLETYQMSPTHLNNFIDMEYSGPESFLLGTLLKFPQAPTGDSEYGNAVHQTLQWYQIQINQDKPANTEQMESQFKKLLAKRYISADQVELYENRGLKSLNAFLKAREPMFKPGDLSEHSFRDEGVLVGEAHLSGMIDHISINQRDKTVAIVDFKTGQPSAKWHSNTKLMKYRQQLYFYKLLIEGSHTFKDYKVSECRLEFVELGDDGISKPLVLDFKDSELKELKSLIELVWGKIQNLDLPNVEKYPKTYGGSKQFIADLLS